MKKKIAGAALAAILTFAFTPHIYAAGTTGAAAGSGTAGTFSGFGHEGAGSAATSEATGVNRQNYQYYNGQNYGPQYYDYGQYHRGNPDIQDFGFNTGYGQNMNQMQSQYPYGTQMQNHNYNTAPAFGQGVYPPQGQAQVPDTFYRNPGVYSGQAQYPGYNQFGNQNRPSSEGVEVYGGLPINLRGAEYRNETAQGGIYIYQENDELWIVLGNIKAKLDTMIYQSPRNNQGSYGTKEIQAPPSSGGEKINLK